MEGDNPGVDVHSLRLETLGDGGDRISAKVFGEEIHFRVTHAPEALRSAYDPFVVAGYVGAMERKRPLTVADDAPVSAALLDNLDQAGWIYSNWFEDLDPIPVEGCAVEEERPGPSGLVGSFFSGGVDSIYSFIQNKDEISHLILCRGLDISFEEVQRWDRTVDLVRAFAEEQGKALILVETNAKLLQSRTRSRNHGAILISTGLSLGLGTLIVPASVTLDLMLPYGSHPLLDPHFSNGVTRVVHDSPVFRTKKVRAIVETGIGLGQMRVCNVLTNGVNCGRCEKCFRTRTTLGLLGAEAPHLPPLRNPKELRKVKLKGRGHLGAWMENLALARQVGREDFVREIEKLVRRFRTKESIQQLDDDYLRGFLFKTKRWFRSS
jgi:hypothetical protein